MQANDLAKAIAVLRSFEDEEREQILPVVLEDWLEVNCEEPQGSCKLRDVGIPIFWSHAFMSKEVAGNLRNLFTVF